MHILFVDDEPRILQGLRRLLFSRRQEWKASFAGGGDEALRLLAAEQVDVLVSDVRMPGMTGVELLRRVRSDHPAAVRVLLSGQVAPDTALEPTEVAHRFLSKPSDPALLFDLLEQLDRFCAEVPITSREIVTSISGLPCAPERVAAFQRALGAGEPDIDSAITIAAADLGMTAKLLQLVNSSFLGAAQPTTDVGEAVRHLGVDVLRTLSESLDIFGRPTAVVPGFSVTALGGAGRANASRRLGPIGHPDHATVVLEEVGQLVLSASCPDRLAADLTEANQSDEPLHELDLRNDHLSHGDIGRHLLALWGLPEAVFRGPRDRAHSDIGAQPGAPASWPLPGLSSFDRILPQDLHR